MSTCNSAQGEEPSQDPCWAKSTITEPRIKILTLNKITNKKHWYKGRKLKRLRGEGAGI